ncbi:hypothetical protein MHYP_G00129870 [Metynnis hypsauchen]
MPPKSSKLTTSTQSLIRPTANSAPSPARAASPMAGTSASAGTASVDISALKSDLIRAVVTEMQLLTKPFGLTQVWNQLEVTHYRLATFTNATRAALQGVKDELTALRLTTVQNRMALDLLLAKEGGVCAMVGDSCCTYIPANDEDHGAISVALDCMQQVSTQLHLDEHGGCLMERVYALASSLNLAPQLYTPLGRPRDAFPA